MRNQNLSLSVHQIVSTGNIDPLGLFENLLFNFFCNVDIIILPPFFELMIVGIAIVVSTVSSAFMNKYRIEVIRSMVDSRICFFNLFINCFNFIFIVVYSILNVLSISAQ